MANTKRLRSFHRWHALAMSVIVIMSAGSGLLHTLMSRPPPPPPATRPAAAVDLAAATLPPSALAARLPADAGAVQSVSVRPIGGRPWYQVISAGRRTPIYADVASGAVDEAADERYAAEIAARHLGGAAVRKTAYLTAYDDEYIAIFRILPVYRFDADDGRGTRVYVSTMTGSVARATDDAKQFEATTFSLLHKWNFIPNKAVRDWALVAAMAGIIALAATGIVLFVRSRRA
jgi:hypothetical protein